MKFKKNFLIFSGAWAVFIAVMADILLVSSFYNIESDVEKSSDIPLVILVPAGVLLLGLGLITFFSFGVIRRQRKRFNSIDGHGQYAFFRNWVCALSVGAMINTVILYDRFKDVLTVVEKDENRRIHSLYSDKPELMNGFIRDLSDRLDAYTNTAFVMTTALCVLGTAGCLFTAHLLVRCYHKHAVTAYSKEVRT